MTFLLVLSSRPRPPSRRFLQSFALFLGVVSPVFTGYYGLSAWQEEPPVKPAYFVLGGLFLFIALGMAIYAWRFAPERPKPGSPGDAGPFGSGRATTA